MTTGEVPRLRWGPARMPAGDHRADDARGLAARLRADGALVTVREVAGAGHGLVLGPDPATRRWLGATARPYLDTGGNDDDDH